ncbi:rhodanese-like domain-containing protein [Algicella marina]|uniref:Rhodanese-like domain-containing protein n=1 Tax=Algicella marina TaxID=2683284 RepID=A0A6P1T3Q3_9RHOB|nr:rhodanese-like domain-containing protein [Algicella marina]QHQ36637.1 rhodanese-like domain-containing protein [Algicella marina]
MTTEAPANVTEMSPETAYAALTDDSNAILVDVRTRPEWTFVGVPDLSSISRQAHLVEWRAFPDMMVNEAFTEQVVAAAGGTLPEQIFFICRSGARSMEAARAVAGFAAAQGLHSMCVNVAEGFEGDLNHDRHRGGLNGWKARGLPWLQS